MSFYNRRKPIDAKLRAAMKRARFSIMDMAAWLDRPYSSVYQWLAGQVPRPLSYDDVLLDLKILRYLATGDLKSEKYHKLRGKERRAAIRKLSSHAGRTRPSQRRSTKRGSLRGMGGAVDTL